MAMQESSNERAKTTFATLRDDVCCELSYIEELTEMLMQSEACFSLTQAQIGAIGVSIQLLKDRAYEKLEAAAQAEARHG